MLDEYLDGEIHFVIFTMQASDDFKEKNVAIVQMEK